MHPDAVPPPRPDSTHMENAEMPAIVQSSWVLGPIEDDEELEPFDADLDEDEELDDLDDLDDEDDDDLDDDDLEDDDEDDDDLIDLDDEYDDAEDDDRPHPGRFEE
jgi:hypothetical protein